VQHSWQIFNKKWAWTGFAIFHNCEIGHIDILRFICILDPRSCCLTLIFLGFGRGMHFNGFLVNIVTAVLTKNWVNVLQFEQVHERYVRN